MLKFFTKRVALFIGRIGADPNDTDEIRLQKALMVAGSFIFILAGALWGLLYFALGQWLPVLIPLSYAIIPLMSVIHFGLTRQHRFFRFSQLILILLLPFL